MFTFEFGFKTTFWLHAGLPLYRAQRSHATKDIDKRGPLKLRAAGMPMGRFDVPDVTCAYVALAPLTALYESDFRRESAGASLARLSKRELVAVELTADIELLDLRPHAARCPVLQSKRNSQTHSIAAKAYAEGAAGIIYRSAQHYEHDCVVLFNPAATATKLLWRSALVNKSGAVNKWVAEAWKCSGVPLYP